mgnify:CR=1 FL=1
MKPSAICKNSLPRKPLGIAGKTAPSLNPLILYHTLDISLCWSYQQVVARGIDWLVVFASCWDFSECPLGMPAPSTTSRRGKGFESGTASSRAVTACPRSAAASSVLDPPEAAKSRPHSLRCCGRLFSLVGLSRTVFRTRRTMPAGGALRSSLASRLGQT